MPRPGGDVELSPAGALGDAVANADYVVIAVPLTPATTNLVGPAVLARMKPDAFVVNVARGGIVDEIALAAALRAGALAGAALDVFADEPLPSASPMWDTPRLVITPHVAGLGERYIARCAEMLVTNVAALVAGTSRRGVIDRANGY
jgi:phosphoglycerate dehydrogenase-like enzyme